MGEAIEKIKGACAILAGAGTGKTHTIVEKIKYLIEKGVRPEKIVCITFSNEAANNLLLRVERELGLISSEKTERPIIRTFHGFSADLLRENAEKIELSKDFKILDPDQAKVILHRNFRITAFNCHRYVNTIGTAKDLGISLEEFQKFLEREIAKYPGIELEKKFEELSFELQTLHLKKDWSRKKFLAAEIKKIKNIVELRKFVNAWNAYEKLKKKGNYQDYSDLNVNALNLLQNNPEIAQEYEYIIVDEFQDTNKLQLDFLVKLAINGNITVVGDLNQSIYRFRGAYKDTFSSFKRVFNVSDKDVFTLAKSYRSSNLVLRSAHTLILNNYENKNECFFVENVHGREGDKIEIYEMKDAREEARKVVEIVKKEIERGVALEDICILFRAHQYGRIIKKALEAEKISFCSVSKSSLLKQKSVRTVIDYATVLLKLKNNEKGGEDSFWDLIYQLGFSREDLISVGKAIKKISGNGRNNSLKQNNYEDENKTSICRYLFENLQSIVSDKGKIASSILIEKLKNLLPEIEKPISSFIQEIYKTSGLLNEQKTREEKEIMLNLNRFYELAKIHEELYDSQLESFLYYLEVLETLGIELDAAELEEEGVRLMTCHATKGLEYKTVILTNMSQGRFPIERYSTNSLIPTELLPDIKEQLKGLSSEEAEDFVKNYERHHQILEERRLCYVSFTRAKEKLILTYAKEYAGKETLPSMFLNEIKYKQNPDILFRIDSDSKYFDLQEVRSSQININSFISADEVEKAILSSEDDSKKEEARKLSPSALRLFDECEKQFEYKYVYNMPDRKTLSWEAMRLGSFVHLVLEKGVSAGFTELESFIELARELSLNEDWESVELDEAYTLIKVFFERNKGRYSRSSKTEQYLPLNIDGFDFIGFADRIDFTGSGVEIVDYKTGKTNISPKDRNWQLGFYALAAQEHYGKVKRVVLDMLKQERPLEFEIDDKGNAHCISSKFIEGFNINEVKKEIMEVAKRIKEAYVSGFKPCLIEKNCDFCNEYVYGL